MEFLDYENYEGIKSIECEDNNIIYKVEISLHGAVYDNNGFNLETSIYEKANIIFNKFHNIITIYFDKPLEKYNKKLLHFLSYSPVEIHDYGFGCSIKPQISYQGICIFQYKNTDKNEYFIGNELNIYLPKHESKFDCPWNPNATHCENCGLCDND